MNAKKQEALAEMEFGDDVKFFHEKGCLIVETEGGGATTRNYDESDDDMDRIVRGFNSLQMVVYLDCLLEIVGDDSLGDADNEGRMHQATASQKGDAALRAIGKWTEEMGG